MSDVETFHDSQAERETEEEEVIFRENNPRVEISTPPNMISANDLDVVIEGWERKFEHLSQCWRKIQLASEKANTTMSNIVRDSRERGYSGAPHQRDVRGIDAVPREMRPRAPHSTTQCRRANREHAFHAYGGAKSTSSRLRLRVSS